MKCHCLVWVQWFALSPKPKYSGVMPFRSALLGYNIDEEQSRFLAGPAVCVWAAHTGVPRGFSPGTPPASHAQDLLVQVRTVPSESEGV